VLVTTEDVQLPPRDPEHHRNNPYEQPHPLLPLASQKLPSNPPAKSPSTRLRLWSKPTTHPKVTHPKSPSSHPSSHPPHLYSLILRWRPKRQPNVPEQLPEETGGLLWAGEAGEAAGEMEYLPA
jgi:hypothetical protein